jgi:hypothetical protein
MKILLFLALTAVITTSGLLAWTAATTDTIPAVSAADLTPVKKTMRAFNSEQELVQYFRQLEERARRSSRDDIVPPASATILSVEIPAPDQGEVESVTNTQHAGGDAGGIVRVHGDHLVVLRRGRLFTVAINDGALKPVSSVDAFDPDINPTRTFYDKMLIAADTVVVIGYSFDRETTEVGLFDIGSDGRLAYRSTYQLRLNESGRNNSSRLIGNKLIFYSPQSFHDDYEHRFESFPAVRRWRPGPTASEFHSIVPATRVYRPEFDFDVSHETAVHTVTICDLANGGFDCQGTSVIGPPGEVSYVSPDSVYIWATTWERKKQDRSIVFRMPLDGSGPSALRVSGVPVDYLSFLQSEDQYLNVLVQAQGKGDGRWRAEVTEGDLALARIPIMSFSDGSTAMPSSNYRALPKPEGYRFNNRFVGSYLLYGTGSGAEDPKKSVEKWNLFLVDWASGNLQQLKLTHGVGRIEQMGADAVVVGTAGNDVHFSAVRLDQRPEIVSQYTRKEAVQGESRRQGFFYKPDGDQSGMLALPILVPGSLTLKQMLFENSAAIVFLRNDSLQIREVGELGSQPEKAIDDRCRASCLDWYGNARPVFLRGRVFALLGYEIVEGGLDDGRLHELRRVNYGPQRS